MQGISTGVLGPLVGPNLTHRCQSPCVGVAKTAPIFTLAAVMQFGPACSVQEDTGGRRSDL